MRIISILTMTLVVLFVFVSCGEDGKSGVTALTSVIDEVAGENCINGGLKVETGLDRNSNGTLDESEVNSAKYICNGEAGQDGEAGVIGDSGVDGVDGETGLTGDSGVDGICAENHMPVITSITVNAEQFDTLPIVVSSVDAIAVTINATDEDGDVLSYSISGSGATISENNNEKENFSFVFDGVGVYNFTAVVSDGCQMVVKSFAVYVPCAGDFPDYNDGLCWSDRSSTAMIYTEAVDFCLELGGHLATINELRTLVQNCAFTVTAGDCNLTDACYSASACRNDSCNGCEADTYVYSVFGDSEWLFSSVIPSDQPSFVWGLNFSSGKLSMTSTLNSTYYFRCVE